MALGKERGAGDGGDFYADEQARFIDGDRVDGKYEKYRDEESYRDEEDSGDEGNSMLSEGQIRDLVQKQLQALQELDQKLKDESGDEDEMEEEAFLDEVRRTSPQTRYGKPEDPAKALLDLEAATKKALGKLEGETFDDMDLKGDTFNFDGGSEYSDDDAFELNVDHDYRTNIDEI
jgi:hypothetical protein